MFLSRVSCGKMTRADGHYAAWPGWVVSVSASPNTTKAVPGMYFGSKAAELDGWVKGVGSGKDSRMIPRVLAEHLVDAESLTTVVKMVNSRFWG